MSVARTVPVENDNACPHEEQLSMLRRFARQRQRVGMRSKGMPRPSEKGPCVVPVESLAEGFEK